MINPVIIPAPDSVICPSCIGWGTSLRSTVNNKGEFDGFELIVCKKCEGTGRRTIPLSEIKLKG